MAERVPHDAFPEPVSDDPHWLGWMIEGDDVYFEVRQLIRWLLIAVADADPDDEAIQMVCSWVLRTTRALSDMAEVARIEFGEGTEPP